MLHEVRLEDEHGEKVHWPLTFQHGRYWFKLKRLTPTGEVLAEDVGQRPLYRSEEVIDASLVLIVEGPKTAEFGRAIEPLLPPGWIFTTASGGAGKWRLTEPQARQILTGKPVVVLPDNDDPGRRHAEDVRRSLAGVAASVKVVNLTNLPEKGDLADWLGEAVRYGS